ncbi:interaptin-like [Centruroides sculpturatus]|uniref:interaptin-like n=1 Tax=Centruroides sculpturatus TaxID=218467 RepID=UPI000C6EA317|nr:interaptin-like [Centruroides sculpturatus]
MEDSNFSKKILHGVSLTRDVSSYAEFGKKNLQDINRNNFCKDSFKRKENITEKNSNVYNVNEYFASTPNREIYQSSKYSWKRDYGLSSDDSEENLIKDEIYKTDTKYNKKFTRYQNGSTREERELSTTDLNILINDTERKMPEFKNVSHLQKDSKRLEDEEISEVKKKSDQLHEKIKSLNAKHMKTIDQIENLEKIANNEYEQCYNTSQNDLLKMIDELRKENENLKTCLDNFITDAIRANNALISKIKASQKSSNKLNRLVQETRRKLYCKCEEINKINEEISSHRDKSDRIKRKLDDINEYVEQLKRNIDNIDKQNETDEILREMNQFIRNVDINEETLSEELIETNVKEKLGQIFKTLKEEKQNIKATTRYIQKLQNNIQNEDKRLKKRNVKKFGRENKIYWKKKLDRLNQNMEDFEEVTDKSIIDEEERRKYLKTVDYHVIDKEKGSIKFPKRFISSHPTTASVSTMTEVYTLDDITTIEGEDSNKEEQTRHIDNSKQI